MGGLGWCYAVQGRGETGGLASRRQGPDKETANGRGKKRQSSNKATSLSWLWPSSPLPGEGRIAIAFLFPYANRMCLAQDPLPLAET